MIRSILVLVCTVVLVPADALAAGVDTWRGWTLGASTSGVTLKKRGCDVEQMPNEMLAASCSEESFGGVAIDQLWVGVRAGTVTEFTAVFRAARTETFAKLRRAFGAQYGAPASCVAVADWHRRFKKSIQSTPYQINF